MMSRALKLEFQPEPFVPQSITQRNKGFPVKRFCFLCSPPPAFRGRRLTGSGGFNRLKKKDAVHVVHIPVDDKSRFLQWITFANHCRTGDYKANTLFVSRKNEISFIQQEQQGRTANRTFVLFLCDSS